MKRIVLILFFTGINYCFSQINIVPNGSFEIDTNCLPGSITNSNLPSPWIRLFGSTDFYHPCKSVIFSSPNNIYGYQNPNSGFGYTGSYLFATTWTYREIVSVELLESLIPQKKYIVEFYVSLADSSWYACKNIGAYLSENEPSANLDTLLNKEPQVKYTGTDFLTEKTNWVKIEGSFTAIGGERYITLGNFDDDINTDTLFVEGGGFNPNEPDAWNASYYYIDDVSVTVDTTTGLEEYEMLRFEIYPNPARNSVTVETEKINDITELRVYDITGRVVLTTTLTDDKTTIDVSGFAGGVYTAVLYEKRIPITRKKIAIE